MTNEETIKFLQSKQIPQCGDKVYTADEEYEAYQRAIDALEQQPSDTVSRGAFKQVMWERDVAIRQLEELGYGFGQKVEPCDDAISREAVKKWICKTCPDDSECQRDCDVIKGIDALPPVTPQQKYGKWIYTGDYLTEGMLKCSECGEEIDVSESYYDFCPVCGAKMQESEEV